MDHDEAVRTGQDVVREVLAALAPGELPAVAAVLRAYRNRPWTVRDTPPALPAGPQVVWAPFVLAFVAETVVSLATGEPAAGPAPTGWARFTALLDRWRPRAAGPARAPDVPVPAFDHEQLRRVWAAATDAATDHGCSLGDREAFAAAMVAALAAGHLPRRSSYPA